jgi:PAS domain S-box-containing protein
MHIMSNIPESSNISIIIWIIGLIVATRKYGLFIFTPATAANNIIKIMSDPLFMVKPNGVIAHINPAASRLLRRESYQIINKPFLSIFQSPLIDQTNNLMNQSKTNIEGELLASNGNKIPVLLSSSIIRDDTSDILGVVCITRDITEQKKNKEKLEKLVEERTAELKKAKMKAEESDKLKSAFLANMSHEIRTPMNAIIGFSDMMKHDDINEEEKNIIHDQIHDNGIMLLNIIDDIIDVAKIDSGQVKIKPTKTEIKKVLDDVYLTIREIIRSKKISDIELHKKTPQESFFVVTDPFRLKQILINLLKNAIKFTNAGYVQFGYNLNDQNEIEFFVEDTGIGISKSDLEKIFDRFQKIIGETDERFYNGTGLGLSISKELVG